MRTSWIARELAKIAARKRLPAAPRKRLMIYNADGRWIAGSSRHTLEKLLTILQPGERIYLLRWHETWSTYRSGKRPQLRLMFGDGDAPKPKMGHPRARLAFNVPLPPRAGSVSRRYARRRRRGGQRDADEAR